MTKVYVYIPDFVSGILVFRSATEALTHIRNTVPGESDLSLEECVGFYLEEATLLT